MQPHVPYVPEDPSEGLPAVPPAHAPQEPILNAATWVTMATTVLTLVAAFGLPLDNNQQAAVIGTVAVVAPIVLALIARSKAWAPATVAKVVAAERQKAIQGQ